MTTPDQTKQVSELFSPKRTEKQLGTIYQKGLAQADPYWNFGYPILTHALADLERGLWLITSPENVGKSIFQVNLGYNVLTHSTDTFWLDFSIDDETRSRVGYLIARVGDIPISLVKRAGAAPDEEKEKRRLAFKDFNTKYGERYHLIAVSDDGEDVSFEVDNICNTIKAARQKIGPTPKLLVTIDGFHDMHITADSECDRQKKISQFVKRTANEANALIAVTAQTRKDSRKRNLTADIIKGEDTPVFDAKVITHLYSDVNFKRESADIWWESEEHPNIKLPVHELDILKNKAGGIKKVIFYNCYPDKAWDFEVSKDYQEVYQQIIFKKSKEKK